MEQHPGIVYEHIHQIAGRLLRGNDRGALSELAEHRSGLAEGFRVF